MKRYVPVMGMLALTILAGCSHHAKPAPALHASAYGSALAVSSGDKQLGTPGAPLPQPLVIEVNDDQGNGVQGALVKFSGPAGVSFNPAAALSDSNGEVSTNVTVGDSSGRYTVEVITTDKKGKEIPLQVNELAAGYQEMLGYEVQKKYCSRCHDPNSTPEQVSNYGNLAVAPHPFDRGNTFNKLSDADLASIISHGGPAMNLSALMPDYGSTLSKADIRAVIAYIRLVSNPPFQAPGMVYATR